MLSDFRSVLAGDLVAKGMTALSIFLAIRYFTPTELATYIYFAGIGGTAYTFFNGFFNRQYIFSEKQDRNITGYRLSATVLTVLSCLALLCFSNIFDVSLFFPTVILALAAMDYEFKRTVLQKAERFRVFAVAETSRAALFLLTAVIVVLEVRNDRPALLLYAQALSYIVASAFLKFRNIEMDSVRIQVSSVISKIISVESAMLMFYFVLVGLFAGLPILLYKPISTEFQFAELGSAFRYFGFLVSVAAAVNVVSLPRISRSTPETTLALLRSMRHVFGISIVLVVAAVTAGFIAIPVVDRGAYPAAPVHFAILSTATLISVFVGPLSALYLRWGRLSFLLATQVLAVGFAAGVIFFLADASSYWVAAALPIGILTQLCALLAGSRQVYKIAKSGSL